MSAINREMDNLHTGLSGSTSYIATTLAESGSIALVTASERFAHKLELFGCMLQEYSNPEMRDSLLLAFAHLDANLDQADEGQFDRFNQLKTKFHEKDQTIVASDRAVNQVAEDDVVVDGLTQQRPMSR